ncbi:DegT/DnrJ/EryC1/StrS family aminotransferase [Cylindrospermopsis curvispora]|uniref:DegT/DnrJ/EryC1/StrS family aminotransferase n=1 Tax=Cylindrospermopsis curvispora GIHE-G1 TaxID=2666332 RepID=A0A7H0F1M9_9CYAN|nr:DegT/DnrJ/EryC1/StrS family aminotransferase [Cylindrospermopsis curvispora]QNP29945.1 DegT/DnrJ/EryC1/StrS family aminotransferase [Cylindrospermopsis curvispora GIHE-G1]
MLKSQGINAVFHYVPLHSSPAGHRLTKVHGSMENTNHLSDCLLRLPMFPQLEFSQIEAIVTSVNRFLGS